MEHPRFIRAIHRFFNPPRHGELRQLEKLRQERHVKADEYERRKVELEWPDDTTYGQIYTTLAFIVALVVVGAFMLALRG